MAWTQGDIDNLLSAIGEGILETEYAGRKTRFRSLAEMKQTLQMMRDAVAPSSAAPRFSDTIYDRGDC